MIQPLGTYAAARESLFQSKPAGLDAQLSQLQSQLADCVNCASARTPEGKAKIQEISLKIQSLKARIEAQAAARKPEPTAQAHEGNGPDSFQAASVLRNEPPGPKLRNPSEPAPASATIPPGSLLDLTT